MRPRPIAAALVPPPRLSPIHCGPASAHPVRRSAGIAGRRLAIMAALFRRIRPDNRAVLDLYQGSPMRSIVATVSLPFVASSLIALLSAVPALAGEIEAASTIDAVTVYPDAAVITRLATVDLPAGDSVLAFKDLPLALDPASLRVSGAGDNKIAIGSVDANIAPAAAKTPDSALETKLASLQEERETV